MVETNENGFKRENVEAICATGKSSKKAEALSQQIGEKGFGFKSVFSVANEVHVQSGVWSFRFTHNRGEDGLGMVTPLEADFDDLPLDVATRITLKFPRKDTHEYARLLDEITKLPETTLLHLHNLKTINIQRPDQSLRLKILYPKQHSYTGSETKAIEKSVVINGKSKTTHSYFHVFESEMEMPEDERRQGRTISKIELAFPFDARTLEPKPSAVGQYIFAYLPLHQLPIQVSSFPVHIVVWLTNHSLLFRVTSSRLQIAKTSMTAHGTMSSEMVSYRLFAGLCQPSLWKMKQAL